MRKSQSTNMNYTEFLELLTKNKIDFNNRTHIPDIDEKFFKAQRHSLRWIEVDESERKIDFIIQHWLTGGVSGGSCWDSSDPRPYTENNTPKGFEALDKILEVVCPTISFLQYKKLSELINSASATNYEYYGNRDDYEYQYVNLKDLYDFLLKNCNLSGIGH